MFLSSKPWVTVAGPLRCVSLTSLDLMENISEHPIWAIAKNPQSDLCLGHSNTLILFGSNASFPAQEECLGSLPCWKVSPALFHSHHIMALPLYFILEIHVQGNIQWHITFKAITMFALEHLLHKRQEFLFYTTNYVFFFLILRYK